MNNIIPEKKTQKVVVFTMFSIAVTAILITLLQSNAHDSVQHVNVSFRPILDDGLEKENPLEEDFSGNFSENFFPDFDQTIGAEETLPPNIDDREPTSKPSVVRNLTGYVPKFMRNNPDAYKDKKIPHFHNYLHYHYVLCPYFAEYIVNSSPPTHHRVCFSHLSDIGWEGRCVQTYEEIPGLIRGDNSTVLVYKNCLFQPL